MINVISISYPINCLSTVLLLWFLLNFVIQWIFMEHYNNYLWTSISGSCGVSKCWSSKCSNGKHIISIATSLLWTIANNGALEYLHWWFFMLLHLWLNTVVCRINFANFFTYGVSLLIIKRKTHLLHRFYIISWIF